MFTFQCDTIKWRRLTWHQNKKQKTKQTNSKQWIGRERERQREKQQYVNHRKFVLIFDETNEFKRWLFVDFYSVLYQFNLFEVFFSFFFYLQI